MLDQSKQVPVALAALQDCLADCLCAVYLYGSAVSGGLRPQSDIDLLAMVDRRMTQRERANLLSSLLKLSGRHPPKPGGLRCLEVTVFTRPDLAAGLFPARAEFIFGEWLRDAFEAGETPMSAQSAEFTLVLAQAQQEAITLFGQDRDRLLPVIPVTDVRHAMRELLPELLGGIREDTRNVLLTLARIWHTAENGTFVSKDEGASWAMPRLSDRSALTLSYARRAYLGEVRDNWNNLQDRMECLAEELTSKINQAMSSYGPLPEIPTKQDS
ncbi:aminoglycoside adenylyltransferase family protein [Rhizobium sp. NTR19]|uniref:Aminoglycoside (3'') (9) adenylyltransferase n=1 Tax=Neorhizobium turbinariae TaxID=2937795 RepID=A0ABT0IWJ4_9HYPH|nr:aminoglycoside adenylyltransferase family protein [Neorhizobium turbinariae]MCK8782257.1 aminoglycoside adenylyltransferase family protein [Neorhizobium turbinariae]